MWRNRKDKRFGKTLKEQFILFHDLGMRGTEQFPNSLIKEISIVESYE